MTTTTMTMIERIENNLNNKKCRSAWDKGVNLYAYDLLNTLKEAIEWQGHEPTDRTELKNMLLNGADSWHQASWGGSYLIYNGDIARRLCTPSELKRTRNGERKPNNNEEWLDVQARALTQAANRIYLNAF